MIHYYFLLLILLLQVVLMNSEELVLNVSAAVGKTTALACNTEPRRSSDSSLVLKWYRCQNMQDCEQLIGTVTPTLKCLSTKLSRFHFPARSSEHSNFSMVISDLQEDDAGFYKCVISSPKQILTTQKVFLQIKQVLGTNDSRLTTTTVETTNTKERASPTTLSSSVAEKSLISIAVAVWLSVTALLLFLCLFGRHLYPKSRLQASARWPDVFQRTQACGETTAGLYSTDHPHQRTRRDGPQTEAGVYESLSRPTSDIYRNLHFHTEENG